MITSITVTYNPDVECLRRQLSSLEGQVDSSIIIDNGSINVEEIESLSCQFEAKFLKLEKNMGLAYAQNIGIESAIETGANYLLLLDQDSILGKEFIKNMLHVYQKNSIGILGPLFFDPVTNEPYPGTHYSGPFIKRQKVEEITDVTFVIASGSFFSADVFKKVGPMEEKLFVDYIDVEWSLRAKKLGLRVAMTNSASMAHTIGDSRFNLLGRKISIHTPLRRYYLVRNSFYMNRLPYIPIGYKIREIAFNFLRALLSLILSENKGKTLKMIFWGMRDGVRGKYGPYNHG